MKIQAGLLRGLAALLLLALSSAPALAGKGGLFVNLASDEVARAGMALELSRNLLAGGHAVTVFLNVDGVRIAATNIPQATNGITGKTLQQALKDFIGAGGKVIVCPMCLRQAGLTAEDLIEGAVLGRPELTLPALMDPQTRVISY